MREYGRKRRLQQGYTPVTPFWDNVDKSGGSDACWPWMKGRMPKGYGNTMRLVDGKVVHGSHRIAWALTYGPIPEGFSVLHNCDNPPCCNPTHLFTGTASDNTRDMIEKDRAPTHWFTKTMKGGDLQTKP